MLKIKNNFLSFLLLLIIYATHNWISFFYNATNNVDFSKYYDFLNYFLGLSVTLDYGQGTIYYYLISLFLKRNLDLINLGNTDILITSAVHELNLFLFIVGLLGLYKLLKLNNYDKKIILLCLIALNFFPQSIYMRAVMKPEVLAFALFPWCLLFAEMFLNSKNIKYLYYALPGLVIIINSKASLAAMAIIYFLIFYYKILKIIKVKQLFILFMIFLSLVLIIQVENYNITKLNPFERVYEEEYDYRANPAILFRTNLVEVFRNPFFKYDYQDNFYSIHAKSVINLTILDTFGDHFNQLFDSSVNYFSKNRKEIFVSDSDSFLNSNREVKYSGPLSFFFINKLDHIRKTFSTLMSILFYTLLIFFSFQQKRNRKYFLAPFIGIIILFVNSLGIPSNNFNPYKGDTFKSFYYSFLLIIALAILICELFKKNKNLINTLLTVVFCISIIFIAGHPKANDQLTSERIIVTNEYSIFCEVNNFLFLDNNILKMIHPTGNIENYKSDCKNYSTFNKLNKQNLQDYTNANREICFKENNLIKEKSNSKECRIFWIKEAQSINKSNNQKPIFSLILLAITQIIYFLNSKRIEDYFINKKEEI